MHRRVWKVIGLLAVLALVFVMGAAVGGGIVLATTQALHPLVEQVLAAEQEDEEGGMVIAWVDPDGPAAEAGVKRGDILLKIDEQAVNHDQDMIGYLHNLKPGDQVELTVLHGDDQRTLTAELDDGEAGPYLGLTPCLGLPLERAMISMRMAGPGAWVIQVVPDSPADEAGLQIGDLITSLDGQTLDGETSLADLIAEYAPGDSITLEVRSPGQEPRQVRVELGEHPEEAGRAFLGVQYYHLEDIRLPFGGPHLPEMPPFTDDFLFALPGDQFEGGAVVGQVADDSPAETAGLKRGDVITGVDGQPVDSPKTLADAVADRQPGDVLELAVFRPSGNETMDIEVTLAEHPEEKGKAYLGVSIGGVFIMHGFEDDYGPGSLLPGQPGRRLRLFRSPDELPFHFDLEVEPDWFHFETLPGDCCGNDFFDEV